jgi:hypothetical protein
MQEDQHEELGVDVGDLVLWHHAHSSMTND